MQYVNLVPRWTEILPTWLMMFEQAVTGGCTNPDLVKDNTKQELRRMAQAADNFNDLITYLRSSKTLDWDDEMFENAIQIGRSLNLEEV